nr:MAG TPA: hypothetical protein [Caudoviricetes sp.]
MDRFYQPSIRWLVFICFRYYVIIGRHLLLLYNSGGRRAT